MREQALSENGSWCGRNDDLYIDSLQLIPHKTTVFPHNTTSSCGDLSRQLPYPMDMMNEHTVYHIKIKGHLDTSWQDWFDGLTITLTGDGNTVFSGVILDQAALHGVFKKIRNLGLTLISVNPQAKGEQI